MTGLRPRVPTPNPGRGTRTPDDDTSLTGKQDETVPRKTRSNKSVLFRHLKKKKKTGSLICPDSNEFPRLGETVDDPRPPSVSVPPSGWGRRPMAPPTSVCLGPSFRSLPVSVVSESVLSLDLPSSTLRW